MSVRERLPQRRQSETVTRLYRERPIAITVGFDAASAPREVFATGPKEGSDLAHLLADTCVLISVALQFGVPAEALGRSLGTVPAQDGRGGFDPASVAGLLIDAIATAQRPALIDPEPGA